MAFRRLISALALLPLLCACSPSKEDVSRASKGALENLFATNPTTKGLNLVVGDVTLVTVEPHKTFEGVAVVSRGEMSRNIPIRVIADDEHVLVTPDPVLLAELLPPDQSDSAFMRELIEGLEEGQEAVDEAMASSDEVLKALNAAATPEPAGEFPTTSDADAPRNKAHTVIPSGRYVSDANTLLVLSAEGNQPATLILNASPDPSCTEGAVDCVTMEGVIATTDSGMTWSSIGDTPTCALPVEFENRALVLSSSTQPCAGFGSANSHLSTAMAGRYALDGNADGLPSFSCDKATLAVEKMICSSSVLGFLDQALTQRYRSNLAGQGDMATLRRDQREWVAERNRCGDTRCVMNAYLDRLYRLK